MKTGWAAVVSILVGCGCGGGGATDDAGLTADATHDGSPQDSSWDAPSDAAIDGSVDAAPDAPPAPASYVVVEAVAELSANIGEQASVIVHVMNTGGTPLGFSFEISGEVKSRLEQPLASNGCNVVSPGTECIGVVGFFPLAAGDLTSTLTIHPTTSGLADTIIPVIARTKTRVLTHVYPGSGTVTSSSADVTCTQSDCTGEFVGDEVTLTAVPNPGNVFVAWTDSSCGTSPACVVSRSTLPRSLSASFAPILPGQLSLNLTGAPVGTIVSVEDLTAHSQDLLAVCSTSCLVPLPAIERPPQEIRITVDSPGGAPAITGACTGTDRCTFAPSLASTVNVHWTFDPKLTRVGVFETAPLRSTARGPNGEVFASTLTGGGASTWTFKLDTAGHVVWAYPTTGQLLATADGGVAISFPVYGLFTMQGMVVHGADGYLTRREFNNEVYASPSVNVEVDHFARVLAMGANQIYAMPGTKSSMSAIEAWGIFGTGIHWDVTLPGDGARSVTSDTAGAFYLATRLASGSVSATKFSAAGVNLGSIAAVAEAVPLVMTVSSTGDVVTATGTAGPQFFGVGAEMILRRVTSTGQLRFERRIAVDATEPNRAGVVMLPNDDVMWIHGAKGSFGGSVYYPTGLVAERVSPNGNVVWSLTQTSWYPTGGSVEVFDLNVGGGIPVAAGGFSSRSFGLQGWLGIFAP